MGRLSDEFVAPPLSVLDARQGYWRERKRRWQDMGLCAVRGRQETLLPATHRVPGTYKSGCKNMTPATSVFDPVLAEVLVTWFTEPNKLVLDPFAGGPERGVVASVLGRRYVGIDVRPEQVDSDTLFSEVVHGRHTPRYVVGDSAEIAGDVGDGADMVLACPPYFQLETYSEDPRDLSAMDDDGFALAYRRIASRCASALRDGGYAAFVVGDMRDRMGRLKGLPELTCEVMATSGLCLYDRITYIQPYGTAPLRAGRQFRASRKVVGVSEQVLVFRKPQTKEAS